jgi:prepilin-type N-terminal cleavage/methylation domain-containing protein
MTSRKGFTLIELMVVIFIVGILAAVAIPIMRGRIDAAKWSEGKSAAGSIRTAARALIAERGNSFNFTTINGTLTTAAVYNGLGFSSTDLAGKYFSQGAYGIVFVNGAAGNPPTYTITVTAASSTSPDKPTSPSVVTLNDAGTFVETP